MGAIIPVEICKPYEEYELTSGDIRQIVQKIINSVGEESAKRIAKNLSLELGIDDLKN